jgi:hydrogenase expression/formation protein HypD
MNPNPLQFRDPERGAALLRRLERAVERAVARLGGPVSVMHVCGSHEQAIARYGLRARLPAGLDLRMGPGCPVCVTDAPEIDAAVALARSGLPVLTYGDMLRVPGTEMSLEDARAAGARVEVLYAATQAVEIARATPGPVVFFATGFETTAVTTAALLLAAPPPPENLFVLSAHKWVPAAMEIVASDRRSRIAGYLAAGHAATITGFGLFEPFVARHGKPVVVAGFEPLDILAGLALLVEQIADGVARVENAFPRCVSRDGNQRALAALHRVFDTDVGEWRGIARVPDGNLRLRAAFAHRDAAVRFADRLAAAPAPTARANADDCICGAIMSGQADPADCPLFGRACRPDTPVGACMVSTEGACRIWLEHGP